MKTKRKSQQSATIILSLSTLYFGAGISPVRAEDLSDCRFGFTKGQRNSVSELGAYRLEAEPTTASAHSPQVFQTQFSDLPPEPQTPYERLAQDGASVLESGVREIYSALFGPKLAHAAEPPPPSITLEELERLLKSRYPKTRDSLDHF